MSAGANPLAQAWQRHQQGQYQAAERVYRQVLRQYPRHPQALRMLGLLLRQTGRFDEAIKTLRRAVEVQPNMPGHHGELGLAYLSAGRIDEAEASLRRTIELDPGASEAHFHLGRILLIRLEAESAQREFELAIEQKPRRADYRAHLASALLRQGRPAEAVPQLEAALQTAPDVIPWRTLLAIALEMLGRREESLGQFDRVLSERPTHADALLGKAHALDQLGRSDEAWSLLADAAARGAADAALLAALAEHARRDGRAADAVEPIVEYLGRPNVPAPDRVGLLFRLGALHEDLHRVDEAFECYREANALRSAEWDPARYGALVDRTIDFYTPERLKALPRARVESNRPIFIVGMPRSGTSLVEQILASHPDVHAAGELSGIPRIAAKVPAAAGRPDGAYPECLEGLLPEQADELARQYLDDLARRSGDRPRTTDKLPLNFQHLGLISRLFPGSRVIHVARDPMDTCLSCYASPLPAANRFATSLEHLGRYYGQYRRLMDHWRRTLDLDMLDVEYDRLIDEPEAQIRRLLDFCGLAFDDVCLRFYETSRPFQTPNLHQIQRPIQGASRGRHERFGARLDPLRRALRESGVAV